MRVAVFGTQLYEKAFLELASQRFDYTLVFFQKIMTSATVLAAGLPTICTFVNDILNASVLAQCAQNGTKLIGLQCAGFNNVDLQASQVSGITVLRVPACSPPIISDTLSLTKPGLLIVNTGRGALIDTHALIDALKSGRLGRVTLDVYEQEGDLFFRDLPSIVIQDDPFQRSLKFSNVLVTDHQAFLTEEALTAVSLTMLQNIADFEVGHPDPAKLVEARVLTEPKS
ncbi:MAG: hypothetical protein MMC33_001000 [Icmadophila ericetorum]|nr:hypothetical protein [Icmadophila ericetorum]